MRRVLLAIAVGILAVAAGGVSQPPRAGGAVQRSCGSYAVRAVVAGRARCLRDAQPCVRRLERQYGRAGFHCRDDRILVATWRRISRPLHIPALGPGGACPVSAPSAGVDFSAEFGVGPGIGPGPVYPTHYDPRGPDLSVVTLKFPPPPGLVGVGAGWNAWKHVWVVLPAYQGPVLIRGRQLDGPNQVGFGDAVVPPIEHRLPVRPAQLTGTLRFERSFSRVREPGCYAYQIDGTTFSYLVVFQIRAA
jgi:hypothetical protein